jgi:hypothetical protein
MAPAEHDPNQQHAPAIAISVRCDNQATWDHFGDFRDLTWPRIPATRSARVVDRSAPERGRRECRGRAAPAVSRAMCTENTHTSIQVQRRHSGIPCAMVLRLMPHSPRRRIRLVTVAGELAVLSNPVGLAKTSADLTPATGARTTWFCRTLRRRSSCALVNRSRKTALRTFAHPTLPRPPHPCPT